uniref:RNase H type-1 domain-containing protein n=1 Tax=Leersia perrieri TaxID=77586 RepID=A0A0D9WND0_9ORYZ
MEWIRMPVILESDCHTIIDRLKSCREDRSRWAFLVQDIKSAIALLQERLRNGLSTARFGALMLRPVFSDF